MSNGRNLPRAALVAVLLGLLALAGCDMGSQPPQPPTPIPPQPTQTPTGPGPGGVSTPSTPPSALPLTPGSGMPRITYEVSGGFIGVREVLEVSTTGEARLAGKSGPLNTRQLDPQRIQKLNRLVAAAGFNNLKPKYDNGQVADDIYETVAVSPATGKAMSVTVAAEGGKGLTPPAVLDLLKELRDITASMRAKPTPRKAPATP